MLKKTSALLSPFFFLIVFFFSCYTHTTTFPSRKDVSAFLLCLGQDYVSQSLITFLLISYSIPQWWPPLVWYFWETRTRLLFGWTPAPSSLYQSWIPPVFATLFPSSPLPPPSPTRFSPAWKPGRNLWHLGADVFCMDVRGVMGLWARQSWHLPGGYENLRGALDAFTCPGRLGPENKI